MNHGPFIPERKTVAEFFLLQALFVVLFYCIYTFTNTTAAASNETLLQWYHPLELQIPFIPEWFIAYFSIGILLLAPLFFLEAPLFRRYFVAQGLATFIAAFFFYFFPFECGFERAIPEQGAWRSILTFFYEHDQPHNLVPSLHVGYTFTALFFIRTRSEGAWRRFFELFASAICLSVLLTHQHHVIDIVTGLLLSALVYQIAQTLPDRWGPRFHVPTSHLAHTLPPGPSRALFPAVITLTRVLLNPFKGLQRLRDRHGDPFTARLVTMGDVVLTGQPELVKKIFKLPPKSFSLMNTPMIEFFFGSQSLFTLEGEPHQRDRKLIMPHFRGELMRAYGDTMAECTIKHLAPHQDGEKISLMTLAQNTTLEVMMKILLGMNRPERIEQMKEILQGWNASQSPLLGFGIFRHNFGGIGPYAKFAKHNVAIRAVIRELIAEFRSEESGNNTILSLLVRTTYEDGTPMTDEHITDAMLTLVIAGFDTTANTICWSLEILHRHPEVLEKVLQEIDALAPDAPVDELTHLPWLDAVCYEILRLYPPIESLPVRLLKEPLELGDYTIPAGVGVCPSPILAHTIPERYPEPHHFNPERFLGKKPSPFEVFPFGGGVRLCVGHAFAHYQMRIVLGISLRHYRFEPLGSHPTPKRYSVLVGPNHPCPARIFHRPEHPAPLGSAS
jgi:cytochrome P450